MHDLDGLTWEDRLQKVPSKPREPHGYKHELLQPEHIGVVQCTRDLKDRLTTRKSSSRTWLVVNCQGSSPRSTQSKDSPVHWEPEATWKGWRITAGAQKREHRHTFILETCAYWWLTTCQFPLQTIISSSTLEMSAVNRWRTAAFQCV